MELYRNGLKLTATIGLDESRGSVNVPVRLLHNEKDKYLNYTEQIHIRYLFDNQVKEEILPTNDNGFYIPGKPLSHDGPIELAVHLINGNIELVTNELSFVVKNAPNGTTQVDPSEFTWQQLVDQYVNAKLDTFANKLDLSKFEETVNGSIENQSQNIESFKTEVNANLSNQDKKITDLQNTTKVSLDSQNTKIDNFKSEVNTSLSNQNTSINQTTSAQNSKITTLESRMDTFTRLSEGSTTGDAELQDIRVGANGITYDTAGNAVRCQYSQIKEDLSYVVAIQNKNLIGTDPNVFYPVDIPKGTYITTSSPDEAVMLDNRIIFYGYDENKNMVDSWSVFFDSKGRTICLSDLIDIKYLKISYKPSFRVQIEIGKNATSYSDYNKPTSRLSDFAINEIFKKLGMTTTKLSFTRGIMINNNGYFVGDQTLHNRAYSENMYFEKGDVISSINGLHYVNRIELDKNDRIISDNDNYECTTRVIENSGYYRFMIADVENLQYDILLDKVDFVVIRRFNKYIKTATQRFNDNFKCKTVAHTGLLTSEFPRNSKEGFLESAKCDTIWGIETDLQTTSDGVIVCLHDPYHGRLTSGTGIVSQLTWDWQYENIRLSFDYVGTPSEYRICTFDEYLRICKTYGKVPIIDLKVGESDIQVVYNYEKIVNMLKEYGLEDRAIFTSMSCDFLNGIRQYSENACLLYDDYTYKNPEWIISQYFGRNRNAGMSLNMNYNLTSDEVKNYHKNGLIMCNWTATNTDYQGAIKQRNLGIDFAVCDLIDDILKYD